MSPEALQNLDVLLDSVVDCFTPEVEMKWDAVERTPGSFDFTAMDALANFARANRKRLYGHTLLWHNNVPDWLEKGKYTSRQLTAILHGHIRTVMTHHRGKVYAWDVVNEAFQDNGSMRHTIWYDHPGTGAGEPKPAEPGVTPRCAPGRSRPKSVPGPSPSMVPTRGAGACREKRRPAFRSSGGRMNRQSEVFVAFGTIRAVVAMVPVGEGAA